VNTAIPFLPPRLRGAFHRLRTEGSGSLRETAAVSLGVFIGCLPLYGLHLLICWTVGFALGLNRLKMYLAANISNPFIAPWLIFAEIQTGAWLRRGSFHPLSRDTITSTGIGVFGMDALVGSMFVGGVLAVLAATGTYALVRGSGGDPMYADLVRRASDRYLAGSITAWEFARGKLRMDPVYRAALCPAILPPGGTLLDIGCGQGLTLALLVEARQAFDERRWPASWPEPPRFDRMVGIETRPRPAASARKALHGAAEVIHGDARTLTIEPARAVLLFDVLQLLESHEQDALLGSLASRLEPAGVVLIREADPAAGWRFTAVRVGNGLKALVFRTRRTQTFNPRTQAEWRDCFARHGFLSETRPMGDSTPFANVLFRLTRAADESARTVQPALPA
jgi:SAM-dependent methyltransferase